MSVNKPSNQDLIELEQKLRAPRHKKMMRVSGKSVLKLAKIIKQKPRSEQQKNR